MAFTPVSTSTASKTTTEVGLASNNMPLPTQNHTSGVLQIATRNQQGNATRTINWWQPPSDSSDASDSQDVDMEDWDSCEVPELDDDDIMSISSDGDQDWDPTEIIPPASPMNLDPTTTIDGDNNTEVMDIDAPSDQLSFWDQYEQMGSDYMMVDADDIPQTSQTPRTFDTNKKAPTIPAIYPHGHPVLRALDADNEVDEEGDILMKLTQSELHY
ncbi:hypothetical protein PG993_009813 [Apiospora rasikravindrae]|uniref:Uncharacterized protein n=1 Tax=Apiospora rasikravindrae TaxID=990691 RepID=A0ABR1SMS1_9PEZI